MQDSHRFASAGRWLLLAAALLLGALTALLGSVVHLARADVLGVLVPYGVLLAVALVVATDVAVASSTLRGGAGRVLLGVGVGRAVLLGVLLIPRSGGDVALTGLPASTVWILLAVLLPAFAAPMVTALGNARAIAARSGSTPMKAAT